MTSDSLTNARWWCDEPVLRRVLADLLAGEMVLMRPGMRLLAQPWPTELDLRADLGADSLDLMGLATAMETVLRLRRPAARDDAAPLAGTRLQNWVAAARSGLDADGSALTFRTSGSSGSPKPCTHAAAALWQETVELAALFPDRRRIVSLVPSHHIYGFLFTVLLPRRLGLGAADVVDLRGLAPGAVAAGLRPGDLVVGFPDFWRGFAQQAGMAVLGDIIGVTSTAPCPDEVARGTVDAGLARLVQVYGSSETAGVGWRDRPDDNYTLFGYWQRAQQADRLERSMPDGQRQSYPLQDRLDWSDAQHFRPAGRVDQAVQVGGINVFPNYVADVLKLHPQVADASVRLMRADEGHRLKAFVVQRQTTVQSAAQADAQVLDAAQADALRTELHAWLGERLSAAECPAAISFGPAVPRGASGKLADWIIDACL